MYLLPFFCLCLCFVLFFFFFFLGVLGVSHHSSTLPPLNNRGLGDCHNALGAELVDSPCKLCKEEELHCGNKSRIAGMDLTLCLCDVFFFFIFFVSLTDKICIAMKS